MSKTSLLSKTSHAIDLSAGSAAVLTGSQPGFRAFLPKSATVRSWRCHPGLHAALDAFPAAGDHGVDQTGELSGCCLHRDGEVPAREAASALGADTVGFPAGGQSGRSSGPPDPVATLGPRSGSPLPPAASDAKPSHEQNRRAAGKADRSGPTSETAVVAVAPPDGRRRSAAFTGLATEPADFGRESLSKPAFLSFTFIDFTFPPSVVRIGFGAIPPMIARFPDPGYQRAPVRP